MPSTRHQQARAECFESELIASQRGPCHEPDLFLKFARLYGEPDFEAAALEWCRGYGMPGASAAENYRGPPDIFICDDGRRMPISAFREEAAEARRILLMYEAVLNRDEKAALTLIHPEDVAYLRSRGIAERELGRRALERALDSARWRVTSVIHDYCAPMLVPTDAHSLEVKSHWNFYNLLGAMYLQMFWLMASGENVGHGEYCGQIISLARPHPEGRKRWRDKRFCDDACRQAHHRSKKKS